MTDTDPAVAMDSHATLTAQTPAEQSDLLPEITCVPYSQSIVTIVVVLL